MKKSSTGTVSSLGCSSLVEYMLSMCEALGSILSTTNEEAEGDSMTGQNLWQQSGKKWTESKVHKYAKPPWDSPQAKGEVVLKLKRHIQSNFTLFQLCNLEQVP